MGLEGARSLAGDTPSDVEGPAGDGPEHMHASSRGRWIYVVVTAIAVLALATWGVRELTSRSGVPEGTALAIPNGSFHIGGSMKAGQTLYVASSQFLNTSDVPITLESVSLQIPEGWQSLGGRAWNMNNTDGYQFGGVAGRSNVSTDPWNAPSRTIQGTVCPAKQMCDYYVMTKVVPNTPGDYTFNVSDVVYSINGSTFHQSLAFELDVHVSA